MPQSFEEQKCLRWWELCSDFSVVPDFQIVQTRIIHSGGLSESYQLRTCCHEREGILNQGEDFPKINGSLSHKRPLATLNRNTVKHYTELSLLTLP